ncbi:MAG TPA: 5'-nucleotidase C-terminal domain-containing protein [Polyangia bacterium]|nr:5'-nucleotidase C-terminal domain-containing protein [Polyangia bacterium]
MLATAVSTGAARAQTAATSSSTAAPPAPVEVLFEADLDGRFGGASCGREGPGGYAGLVATLAAHRRAAEPGAPSPLVLLGGNWAGPDPVAAAILAGGAAGARTMGALLALGHFDAIAIGHQELSLEPAILDELLPALARAGLPLLATNLACDARRPSCAAFKRELLVRRPGSVPIGILATISPSVRAEIAPGRLSGFTLEDPLPAIKAGAARLRAAGAKVIVVLTDGPRDARALDEIDELQRHLAGPAAPDLLLGAGLADEETGRAMRILRRDGAPPVMGSSTAGTALTTAQLLRGDVTTGSIPAEAAGAAPEVGPLLASAEATACAAAAQPVTPAPIHGRMTRDDFIKYVLEVVRRRAGAEMALLNSDFVKRGPFPITGTITLGELERALPYRAVIGAARVQGPIVDSLLGAALANPKLAQVGLSHGAGGLQVNGRPLDKAREYRVATIAFVAAGGDGIFPPKALPFAPLPGAPDLRDEVTAFLRRATGAEDGDPTVSAQTDFGPPPAERPLWVALGDLELDFADTSISNGPAYTDAQLTRAQQTSVKGEATLVAQLRHPVHEGDGRIDLQYGWSRTDTPGMPEVSGETVDLITATALYTWKGLRDARRVPKRLIPDPYARVWLESEFTRPDVTPTQPRDYHHLQLTDTAGAQLTLTSTFKVRGGVGAQSELLAPGSEGAWHAVIEAGAVLNPTVLATFGPLAVKLEGLLDYDFVDPTDTRQHQLRATAKLSVPLVPALFLTAGLDVFAVQREQLGWGSSYDTTIGLRLHTDVAHQQL